MPAKHASSTGAKAPSRISLALAGRGPVGAVYEIGALRALEEALDGVALNDLDIYVGVSAGALVAACLANGLTAAELCRAIVSEHSERVLFDPAKFYSPAFRELRRRLTMVPGLLLGGLWDYLRQRDNYSAFEPILRLARALPAGVFETRPVGEFLHKLFTRAGRSDDFRQLERRLIVVAAELDTGKPVLFSGPGLDQVPISKAVKTSAALPGLYPPVEIDGHFYVDGILRKTMHASVALETGLDLLLAINPIVPVDVSRARDASETRLGMLADRGLTAVMGQTLRTLIRSRMEVGMKTYEAQFLQTFLLLIEPCCDDLRMFFTNIFSFSERKAVCEHGYQRTRAHLREHGAELAPKLAARGVRLRMDVLEDPERTPWKAVRETTARGTKRRTAEPGLELVNRLDGVLDRLEELLPAG